MTLARYYSSILRRCDLSAPTLTEAAQDYRHAQDLNRVAFEFGAI